MLFLFYFQSSFSTCCLLAFALQVYHPKWDTLESASELLGIAPLGHEAGLSQTNHTERDPANRHCQFLWGLTFGSIAHSPLFFKAVFCLLPMTLHCLVFSFPSNCSLSLFWGSIISFQAIKFCVSQSLFQVFSRSVPVNAIHSHGVDHHLML